MPSWVWDHCKKSANGQMATCLVCDSVLKTHGARTPLAHNLQSQHQIYCPPEKRRAVDQDLDNRRTKKIMPSCRKTQTLPTPRCTTATTLHSQGNTANPDSPIGTQLCGLIE